MLFESVLTGDASAITQRTLTGVRIGLAREYRFKDLDPEAPRDGRRFAQIAAGRIELVKAEVQDVAKLRELSTWPIENHAVLPALKQYLEENEVGIAMEDLIAQASADIERDLHDVMAGGSILCQKKCTGRRATFTDPTEEELCRLLSPSRRGRYRSSRSNVSNHTDWRSTGNWRVIEATFYRGFDSFRAYQLKNL